MKDQVRLPGLNRRLVMELDRGRVRELLVAAALSVLMLMPLLLYVWQNTEWIRAGYRIEKLKSQQTRLVEINHKLRLEKASLESPARVESVAVGQLELSQPPAGTVVLVDPGRLRPAPPDKAAGTLAAAQPAKRSADPERPVENAPAN